MQVLVGVDGSDQSVMALKWAGALAAESGGAVQALMAWSYPTSMLMPVFGAPVLPAELLTSNSETALANAVRTASISGVTVDQQVVMGGARALLTDASASADVMVLGRTGHSRLERLFLGSTAAYCVRHSECPVVIVHDSPAPEQQITVAVDGSPSSVSALEWALGLGGDRDILAVYSHDEWELDDLALDDEIRAKLDVDADAHLHAAVCEAVERAGVSPDRVRRQVLEGDPRTTLVDQADPDRLLVFGAQGHSGIARWMLGSLADYAVQHAPGTVAIWR